MVRIELIYETHDQSGQVLFHRCAHAAKLKAANITMLGRSCVFTIYEKVYHDDIFLRETIIFRRIYNLT